MIRRNFLKNTLSSLATIKSVDFNSLLSSSKYTLSVLATKWGFNGSLEDFIKKAKDDSYNGIEIWWNSDFKVQNELLNLLDKYNMKIGFLCGSGESNFQKHLNQFNRNLDEILNSDFSPLYVNCHAGKDYFSYEQNCQIVDLTQSRNKNSKFKILHETHRSRMCFSTISTLKLLEKYPKMGLTLDISHWCNVHESLLHDQEESVLKVLLNTKHIHARVGHEQGPQVNDPRAPEWDKHLNSHLDWWDMAVENQLRAGETQITFLTEFGPPNYMQTLPYTYQAVADQWEINVFMKDLIKERYSNFN